MVEPSARQGCYIRYQTKPLNTANSLLVDPSYFSSCISKIIFLMKTRDVRGCNSISANQSVKALVNIYLSDSVK